MGASNSVYPLEQLVFFYPPPPFGRSVAPTSKTFETRESRNVISSMAGGFPQRIAPLEQNTRTKMQCEDREIT